MTVHGGFDLSKIDAMNMSDDAKDHLRQAWIEADDIMWKFYPEHVTGWPSLLATIERVRNRARINAVVLGGMDPSILDEDQSLAKRLGNELMTMLLKIKLFLYSKRSKE